MRRVLVDSARRKQADKRRAGLGRVGAVAVVVLLALTIFTLAVMIHAPRFSFACEFSRLSFLPESLL